MPFAGNFHPEWGYLAPAPSFMRSVRIALVATAVGATAGAGAVFALMDRTPGEIAPQTASAAVAEAAPQSLALAPSLVAPPASAQANEEASATAPVSAAAAAWGELNATTARAAAEKLRAAMPAFDAPSANTPNSLSAETPNAGSLTAEPDAAPPPLVLPRAIRTAEAAAAEPALPEAVTAAEKKKVAKKKIKVVAKRRPRMDEPGGWNDYGGYGGYGGWRQRHAGDYYYGYR